MTDEEREGSGGDLRVPSKSRVILRVAPQKRPMFMRVLSGLRLHRRMARTSVEPLNHGQSTKFPPNCHGLSRTMARVRSHETPDSIALARCHGSRRGRWCSEFGVQRPSANSCPVGAGCSSLLMGLHGASFSSTTPEVADRSRTRPSNLPRTAPAPRAQRFESTCGAGNQLRRNSVEGGACRAVLPTIAPSESESNSDKLRQAQSNSLFAWASLVCFRLLIPAAWAKEPVYATDLRPFTVLLCRRRCRSRRRRCR